MEKAPTRAFSWLKAATTAFTFKTLLRHYVKRALTPRSLNVKLGLLRDCTTACGTDGALHSTNKDGNPGQKWKQVGVVSFGASAGCEVGYPAGFTRNEYYLDWVCSETNGVGC